MEMELRRGQSPGLAGGGAISIKRLGEAWKEGEERTLGEKKGGTAQEEPKTKRGLRGG